MPQAGDTIVLATVPGANVGTVEQTTDSATFQTTETVVMSIAVPLVTGRRYRVTADLIAATDTPGVNSLWRVREDSVAGTQKQMRQRNIPSTGFGWPVRMFFEFTAVSTANKTFVVTGQRLAGTTELVRLEADATRPAYLYVDYTRDG